MEIFYMLFFGEDGFKQVAGETEMYETQLLDWEWNEYGMLCRKN